MRRIDSLKRAFPFQFHKTQCRGAAALGLPPVQPLDVVIDGNDEISECGKVASQIDDLLIVQVQSSRAAHSEIRKSPVRCTRSSAEKQKSARQKESLSFFLNFAAFCSASLFAP